MKVRCQFHSPAISPQGRIPWYALDRRLSGFHSFLNAVEKRKTSCTCQDSNLDSLDILPASFCNTDLSYTSFLAFVELFKLCYIFSNIFCIQITSICLVLIILILSVTILKLCGNVQNWAGIDWCTHISFYQV